MEHIVKSKNKPQQSLVTPQSAGWEMLGFEVRVLAAGENHDASSREDELCLVFLGGDAEVTFGGETHSIKGRESV